MKISRWCLVGLCILTLVGCKERIAQEKSNERPIIFPDYQEVTIPRTIAPLNFSMEGAEHIVATFSAYGSDETLTATGSTHIEIDEKEWKKLISTPDSIKVCVSMWNREHQEGIEYASFNIYISDDEMDPWVMYRLIPPGYEGWNKMGIYQRDITSFKQKTIVDNTDNGRGCLNCHAACQGNPDNFTFHSRGANGGTVIMSNGNVEKINLKNIGRGLQGSYNCWHPSGKYIAFSSNETHQTFLARSKDKIEAYDLRGDLIIYDVEKHEVYYDDRFTNSLNLESFPTFSPDGKWMYFVSSKHVLLPKEYENLLYSILRVSFNEEDGTLGATIDTIFSAYERQQSAIIPRISADGRYLMYSVSSSGALFQYHVDADLGMIDLQTMQNIDCSRLNSDKSESYHSWSSNGKWVLYASKRIDGRFARIYFSHWDGKNWTKPFLLPQRNPYENTLLMKSYNVPDFIKKPVQISRSKVRELIMPEEKEK